MTISYIAGTTAGSMFAYILDKIIHYEIGYPISWIGGEYHQIEDTIVYSDMEILNLNRINRSAVTSTPVHPSVSSYLSTLLMQSSSHINSTTLSP